MTKTVRQAIILAGGRGTRLAEQTKSIPKPLVEVGNVPIMLHVINHLAAAGVEHIVVAGGYKVDLIKEYFMSDRFKYHGSVTITNDGVQNHQSVLPHSLETLVIADTGLSTGTAQRIKKAHGYLPNPEEPFFMTYGDSVSDVDLGAVVDRFESSNALATLTAVNYHERFGVLSIDPENNQVTEFAEKSMSKDEFINGGFMVLAPEVVDEIREDDNDFSRDTIPRIQEKGGITAHLHTGFWAAMDTQRDYEVLNALYDEQPELFNR